MTHAALNWRIGGMKITRIDETDFALAPDKLYPDWDDAGFDHEIELVRLRTHLWVVERDGLTLVVDTGIGNGKTRPFSALFDRLDNPVLERFETAGFDPHGVDYVLLTHLHVDHVGWNTHWVDGRWTPVFPNATHVFSERERAFFDTPAGEARRMVFEDSVMPLIDAGITRVIPDEGAMLMDGVRFWPSFGHSAGHMAIEIESDGEIAIFSGDVMHSPIQVERPQWSSMFCLDRERARESREWLLSHAANLHATVFPAHFPETSAGKIERNEAGFGWHYLAPYHAG
ncbi:Beta-lactamase-like protein [Caballeronia hypogeia]|uniref:Beta-lactamase-like protein n=1 Tax=Caballeronia hypogeia TaxID=1777140 RepID=A0A158DPM2_9BURK|nr:MBL fold metallo-hydrolase [Caballeronia hypogeia]SAK96552.1 Beta-lactamase-like protein [Caballeronia hypogeia]